MLNYVTFVTYSHIFLSLYFICRCQSQSSGSTLSPLYIGGVPNAFDLSTTAIIGSDFIGSIAAIVIDNQHLNLSCPRASRNTIVGTHYSSVCEDSNVCSDWSVCVPFIQTGSSPCHCNSGLPYETCDSDEGKGYSEYIVWPEPCPKSEF